MEVGNGPRQPVDALSSRRTHGLESSVELLRRAAEGQRDAVERLDERYLPSLGRWVGCRLPRGARQLVAIDELVRGAVRQAVSQPPQDRPQLDGELQLRLRQLVAERITNEMTRLRSYLSAPADGSITPDLGPSILEESIGPDGIRRYESRFEGLEGRQRQAIVSRLELAQSWDEVAAALGEASLDRAKATVGRALFRLAGAREPPPSSRLTRLAAAVADRSLVQWEEQLRQATNEDERRLVEQLQLVEQVFRAHRPDDTLPRRLGDFEIRREIGRGGMGIVYEAVQLSLERRVALKILPAEITVSRTRLERFKREAKSLAALNHPNIVTIYTVESVDDVHFLTMELIEGRRLSECIPDGGLSGKTFFDLAIPLADALSAAHHQGIVHRDLKPANIMVTEENRVKVLDFGLAKLRGVDSDEAGATTTEALSLTQEGALLGTVPYMSPEQVQGLPIDHRSDLFSLGAVFYEMVTGRRAFAGRDRAELMNAILRENPPLVTELVPHLPADLGRIIRHCLQKDPDRRYQTAKGLRGELEELKTDSTSAGSLAAPSPRKRSRSAIRLAVAITAAIALVTAAVLTYLNFSREPPLPAWDSRQLTSDAGWESNPVLSPDGDLVAYASDRDGNEDIWISDIRGGDPLQLTSGPARDSSPAWFPDGSAIAFVSDRSGTASIWKVARLGGRPMLVVPDARDPAVAPDGQRIAFARLGDSNYLRIGLAKLSDASQATMLTSDEDGMFDHRHPAWSPDGQTICYEDWRDLWAIDVGVGRARRLSTEHDGDRDPTWSPDGRHVYFTSRRSGSTALWRMRADGSRAIPLTLGTGPESQPSLSRDGQRLVYSTFNVDPDIVILDLHSGERQTIPGSRREYAPVLLPDGSGVVFCSDRDGEFDLWFQPLAEGRIQGGARKLADDPGSAAPSNISPDGRWIAYGSVVGRQRDIWVLPFPDGLPRRFTDHPAVDMHPAWAPDGTRLVFVSDRDGLDHLWIRDFADGAAIGQARQLTRGERTDRFPSWSPDGTRIAFLGDLRGREEVWVVDVDEASDPRPVTAGAQSLFVRWDPDGRSLWVAGRWGTDSAEIRRIDLDDGSAIPSATRVALNSVEATAAFDISDDRRFIALSWQTVRGDIWIAEAGGGASF